MAFSPARYSCRRAFERPARHRENEIAPELGARRRILHGIDGCGRSFGRGAKRFVAWRGACPRALGLGNAPRIGLGAADRHARLDHLAAFDAIDAERRRHGEVADATAEFIETAAR